jgi:hypothetical protein
MDHSINPQNSRDAEQLSLVMKYHPAGKIFSEDSTKGACGRQCAIIRQKDCLRF